MDPRPPVASSSSSGSGDEFEDAVDFLIWGGSGSGGSESGGSEPADNISPLDAIVPSLVITPAMEAANASATNGQMESDQETSVAVPVAGARPSQTTPSSDIDGNEQQVEGAAASDATHGQDPDAPVSGGEGNGAVHSDGQVPVGARERDETPQEILALNRVESNPDLEAGEDLAVSGGVDGDGDDDTEETVSGEGGKEEGGADRGGDVDGDDGDEAPDDGTTDLVRLSRLQSRGLRVNPIEASDDSPGARC